MNLADILATRLGTTRNAAQKLIYKGIVSVNGVITKNPNATVHAGDVIGYQGSLFTVGE